MKKIFLIFLFFPSILYADDWSRFDNSLQGIYRILHVNDWQQSLAIAESEEYEEANILLGKNPDTDAINLYFASTLFAHHQISRAMKKSNRNYWQIVWILTEFAFVRHNNRLGFRIGINI